MIAAHPGSIMKHKIVWAGDINLRIDSKKNIQKTNDNNYIEYFYTAREQTIKNRKNKANYNKNRKLNMYIWLSFLAVYLIILSVFIVRISDNFYF
jgi:hypothetical protein